MLRMFLTLGAVMVSVLIHGVADSQLTIDDQAVVHIFNNFYITNQRLRNILEWCKNPSHGKIKIGTCILESYNVEITIVC